MLLRMISVRADISASIGTPRYFLSCRWRYCPISQRASVVLMLVYMETASAENKRACGGKSISDRRFFRAKESLKYAGWELAMGCRVASTHFPRLYSRRVPGQDMMGLVDQGSLWILIVW